MLRSEAQEMESKNENTDDQCAEFEHLNAQIFQNNQSNDRENRRSRWPTGVEKYGDWTSQATNNWKRRPDKDEDAMFIPNQSCNGLETVVATKTMEVSRWMVKLANSRKHNITRR